MFLGVVATGAVGGGADDDDQLRSSSNTGITRTDLVGAAGERSGQQLYLQRVTIAPGAKLPEHFHQGTQVARIISGRAHLRHRLGHRRGHARQREDRDRERAGDHQAAQAATGWSRPRGSCTTGATPGKRPVVIEIASLLQEGAPLSTPVGQSATGTPLQVDRRSRLAVAQPPHRRRRRLDDVRLEPARRDRHRRRPAGRRGAARQRELREGQRADLRVRHLHLRRRLHPR